MKYVSQELPSVGGELEDIQNELRVVSKWKPNMINQIVQLVQEKLKKLSCIK